MTNQPNNWVEEDRPEVVEAIVSGMMQNFSQKDLRRMVWDMLYDDLIFHTRLQRGRAQLSAEWRHRAGPA